MSEKLKFKTTINCSGCVAAVTPSLNQVAGEGNWEVDTTNPEKILRVNVASAAPEKVMAAVEKAGYKIEQLV